ncbi:hypothetical protein ZWY2020_012200 [Hordeum vulgare]|nr:hypothetical protein ZWY2020_012200 [Hordeum vulgare]
MAENRRRRRRRRARPQQASEPSLPSALASLSSREVAVVVRPSKKICDASGSISSPSSGSHAWENLLDSLLHQIISLISSFHDFLALVLCHSWHAAFSFPSVYTFSFPPLHLKPNISQESYNSDWKSQLVDPSKKNLSHRCSTPGVTPHPMRYLGCSYGYLIFSDRRHCHLVDVHTGTKVKPPKFQSESNTLIYLGILMALLNSPSLRLILFSRMSMLQWQVGTNFWTEHPLDGEIIHQIVFFKGEMFVMDFIQRLHTICIAPELSTQEVAVMWEESMLVGLHSKPWLVVCAWNQLFGFPGTFQVFCLNFSVEPAKWVKMDKLDNWALFLTNDRRNPTFSCMNPERWGGKSNYIYVPTKSEDFDEPWTAIEIGQLVPSSTHRMSFSSRSHCPLQSTK